MDITVERRLASRFGVTKTPFILLVHADTPDYIPISEGVVSMAEMEENLYRGIKILKGDLKPEDYSIYEFQKGGSFDVTAPLRKGINER